MHKKEGPMLAFLDWRNTFLVQTDASSAGAGAGPLQPEEHERQVLTFASHRVSKVDSSQGPTERECMDVQGPSNTLDSTQLVDVSPWGRTAQHSRGCSVAVTFTRNCTDGP